MKKPKLMIVAAALLVAAATVAGTRPMAGQGGAEGAALAVLKKGS